MSNLTISVTDNLALAHFAAVAESRQYVEMAIHEARVRGDQAAHDMWKARLNVLDNWEVA